MGASLHKVITLDLGQLLLLLSELNIAWEYQLSTKTSIVQDFNKAES